MHITICLLVRNEEAIIEDNIRYHARLGVDRFLVMDHLSSDATPSILGYLGGEFDITVYDQENPTYMQADWMTFLCREANRLGTDWVVMCDADEFWLPDSRDLKKHFAGIPSNIDYIKCQWHSNLPIKGCIPFHANTYFTRGSLPKVAMRSSAEGAVTMGNHDVTHTARVLEDSTMRVMHYRDRDKVTSYTKYVIGGTALRNSGFADDIGVHWREGLAKYEKGEFDSYVDGLFYTEDSARSVTGFYSDDTVHKALTGKRIVGSHQTNKWIEITSMIGCGNRCSYCPQDALSNAYESSEKIMDLETFNRILDHVDADTTAIHFSGFTEIFLHPKGHEFIKIAYDRGFDVVMFSTLSGFTKEKAEYLSDIVFEWVRLHEFSSPVFNQSVFDAHSKLFVEHCRCNRFESAKVENPVSRGGHLWNPGYHAGPVTCDRFNCNVALPDGRLALCCSDWSIKHPIGNIFDFHYDSDEFNSVRKELAKQAATHGTDVLCKTCEMGNRR